MGLLYLYLTIWYQEFETQVDIIKNCIMTNVMHKVLIYLSIYFCLTCFGLSFSPSSEAGVQHRQWFKFVGYGVSAWALTPYRKAGVNR
jgi:hypothetical protein